MHGLPELTRRRVIIALLVIVLLLMGLYFLLPKLAGLGNTWGQLKHGDPVFLAVGGVLELLSILGYTVLFRSVFGRGMPRIDWRASIEIPLAGIAAIRLLSAAGAVELDRRLRGGERVDPALAVGPDEAIVAVDVYDWSQSGLDSSTRRPSGERILSMTRRQLSTSRNLMGDSSSRPFCGRSRRR